MHKIFLFALSLSLCACGPMALQDREALTTLPTDFPTYYDSMKLEVPERILAQIAQDQDFDYTLVQGKPWWESFGSEDLNHLQKIALSGNFDLLSALARLEQSKYQADSAFGGSLPQIGLDASANKRFNTSQNSLSSSSSYSDSTGYELGFSASYELDLWGKVTSERRAAYARYEASKEDVQTAAMTIAASLAETWANLLGNRAEYTVLQRQIAVNESLVTMQETRFKNALASSTDVLQQQESLAASLANVPGVEEQGIMYKNALSVLLGQLPGNLPEFDHNARLPKITPMPEVGLPIELLELRPDIKAAWARLEAADLDVSRARANRFPSIKLSASHAFSAAEPSLIFVNWVSSLVSSLTAPIFDGGQLAAEEKRARAVAEEAVQAYAKVVAQAIEEVSNALVSDVAQQNKLFLQGKQFALAQKSTEAILESYLQGSETFLRFITQFNNTQNQEISLVKQQVNVVKARINLCRALGGMFFPTFSHENIVGEK